MTKFNPYADSSIKIDDCDPAKLNREQMADLMAWCDCQSESLWDGMTLLEILNVYHVSIDYTTFEGWSQEQGDKARKAWNRVVLPDNRLLLAA
jgi:hypothetical protein